MYAAVLNSFYGEDFFNWVEEEAAKVELQEGVITNSSASSDFDKNESIRKSKVSFLQSVELRDELYNVVKWVNANQFGYDIYNLANIQYTIYDGKDEGHYDWHTDDEISIGDARHSVRKLSLTVQLSDPSEYEGGDFELYNYQMNPNCKNKGSVLIFPSTQLHRVTPVTKGIRKSLVAWFQGPEWR